MVACGESDVLAELITPRSITWRWDAGALGDDVNGYVVWYGSNPHDVVTRGGSADSWNVEDDANLGWRYSPYGAGLVERTTVTGLLPDTTYYVQLWAWFVGSDAQVVAEGTATTATEGQERIAIFDDTEPPGAWRIDFEDPSTATQAYTGASALWLAAQGVWINGRLGGMSIDLSALTDDAWQRAYLEFYVRMQASDATSAPMPYAEVRLDNATTSFVYGLPNYVTLPNRTAWHRVQLPLVAFKDEDTALSPASFGDTLTTFSLGGAWPEGFTLFVDDIAVVY